MALNKYEISTIIKLRGLGLRQQEVADYLRISKKTVQNHLLKIREEVLNSNIETDLDEIYNKKIFGEHKYIHDITIRFA